MPTRMVLRRKEEEEEMLLLLFGINFGNLCLVSDFTPFATLANCITSLFFTIVDTVVLGIQYASAKATFIFFNNLFFTSMVILTIFFVAWLFSLAFLELMVNRFTKNLREKTKSCENSQSYSAGCSHNGRNGCTVM